MKVEFDTSQYIQKLRNSSTDYFHTFLNHQNLACGIIVLKPGEEDTQSPHESDEVYYILKGDGFLKINKKEYPISEGKAFFVQKNISHQFFGNTKELVVLYFFGGPDS